jgi:hypothetical protein
LADRASSNLVTLNKLQEYYYINVSDPDTDFNYGNRRQYFSYDGNLLADRHSAEDFIFVYNFIDFDKQYGEFINQINFLWSNDTGETGEIKTFDIYNGLENSINFGPKKEGSYNLTISIGESLNYKISGILISEPNYPPIETVPSFCFPIITQEEKEEN